MLSRHRVGTYQGNELTQNSSGNTRQQLSQLARPLWTDPGLKCAIGVRELISTLTAIFFLKRRRGTNRQTFPQNPRNEKRATTTTSAAAMYQIICIMYKNRSINENRMER